MANRPRDYKPTETLLGYLLLMQQPGGVSIDRAADILDAPPRTLRRYRSQLESMGYALVERRDGKRIVGYSIPATSKPWRLARTLGVRLEDS